MTQSGTNLTTFSPYAVPYQAKVIELIRRDWDYSKGNLEILLSGSYGSAKSILMAHLAVTHCLFYPRSVVMLARKSMPDLRATIFKEILEHLDCEKLIEGTDYTVNQTSATISFSNGSMIESISWADKKYKKGRSRKISFLVFEELVENNEDDKEAFMTLKARLRRLPHVEENVLIAATNPDAPSHWVYKYFFEEKQETKFVFKSVTTDNPFLEKVYIEQLKRDLDSRAIQRYIYGEWIELQKEQVYYNYLSEINFKKEFILLKKEPIIITHDFNIGHNKPMSACAMVRRRGVYHAFKSFHVEGARTLDIMEEIGASGILDNSSHITVYGDASGRNNDTRSIKTDYDIIQHYLSNYRTPEGNSITFELRVPRANPPIRRRHNIVNAHFMNELKEVRLLVYDKWLDEGFRLTAFKKNGDMTEDDSLPQQHITTAIGYVLDYDKYKTSEASRTIQL
ncbi:MAG: hypothetical protein RIQ94_2305 [Pseudomonadota bacterium]|jgi:hypothetical protein